MEVKPGYKQTEVGVFPEDWDLITLGQMFGFKNGLNKAKEFFGYGTPIVNYMDVFQKEGLRITDVLGRVDVNRSELKAYEVRKGDVFFTLTSETVEEIGIASVMLDEPSETVFSGFILRARPTDHSLNDEFKRYCFSARYLRQQVTSRASYTTRALTNGRSLSATFLARPPLPEQRAIATALSDVDALLGGLDRLIAKKRDLKQAAMQQLLTGQTRLPRFEGEWEVKRIDEIADTDPENLSVTTNPSYQFNYISLEDVDYGYLVGCSEQVFVQAPSRARRRVQADDVLVATVRPNLKSHLRFSVQGGEWVCSTGFCVIRCRKEVSDPGYVFQHFFADLVNNQIESLIAGSNYPAINNADIRALSIPIPAIDEQTAIATVLSDMDVEMEALLKRRHKTRDLKQAMMQELLTGRTRLL